MRSALTNSRFLVVPAACVALIAVSAASARAQRASSGLDDRARRTEPAAPTVRLARASQERLEALPRTAPVSSVSELPQDPSLAPLLNVIMSETLSEIERRSQVTPGVLERLQRVTVNFERGRALLELAGEASKSTEIRELLLAHRALERASESAMAERNSLRHDQLLVAVIRATEPLADALVREGLTMSPERIAAQPQPFPGIENVTTLARLARLEWRRGAFLAAQIINPTYRSEYSARVAEWMSRNSSQIIENVRRNESPIDRLPDSRIFNATEIQELERLANDYLLEAAKIAQRIDRPIWRNSALDRIAITAGESGQYAAALQIARGITNAEARAQGLILVAESLCRRGQNEKATESYADAAVAVSRIEKAGLRGVLAGYLVDSLISTGRFEDARACLVLYPTEAERFVGLGAIAESQGRRGSAEAARQWIASEVPPAYRSALYRRVNTGVLAAIANERQNRTRVITPRPPVE